MKCYGCGKIIKKEIKLDDFFKFDFYCENCQKELTIKSIVFPLDDGYMGTLYYIFDEGVNIKLSREKIKEIFILLDKLINKNTLVFVDKNNIDKSLKLKLKENINFFSFKYLDLENCE